MWFGSDEDGVPTAGPAERGHGTVDLRILIGDGFVVGHDDGAFLREEGLRRAASDLVSGFRIGSPHGGQGIGAALYPSVGCREVCEAARADVACEPVADAKRCGEP